MKTGTSRTGQAISGMAYLHQRITDVLTTAQGSLVLRRDFGSKLYQLVDANVDSQFYMQAYIHLANAIAEPANGLDDFKLETMSLTTGDARNVLITLTGQLLNDGQPITIENIVMPT